MAKPRILERVDDLENRVGDIEENGGGGGGGGLPRYP